MTNFDNGDVRDPMTSYDRERLDQADAQTAEFVNNLRASRAEQADRRAAYKEHIAATNADFWGTERTDEDEDGWSA